LIPAGSISGQVTLPDGTPVRDVPVEVLEQYHYEDAGGGSGETRTDAEGRFTIGGLRPATYDVMARLTPKQAEEWAAAVRPGVRLRLAENATNQDIRLTKGVLVTGKITNSETGKLIADQALTIGLVPADETSPLGQLWAETSEGRYRTRIPAVPHRVYFASSAKGFERGEEEPTRVNARDGEEVTVDFALKPKGEPLQVTGRVIGADGKPAAGAAVHAFLTNGYESSFDTMDSTGNFSIEIPKNIKEAVPIFATDGPRRSPIQKVAVGKPITLQLGDKDLTSIRGCVVDEQGKPIPGATVHFQLADDAVNWQHALSTDATGRFELADIWSDVAFNVYGEAEGFGYAHKKVTTTRGKKLDLGNLVLEKADRVLEGVVVDPDGKPASVLLSVSGGSDQPMVSAKSDSEGHFLVSGLLEGKIFLSARQKFGERYVDVARAKAEAGDRQIKLTIKRADTTLHGRLVNSAKQPIAGAMVVIVDHDQPGDISAVTAKDGTFRLPGVFPGWLTVKVMPDRHSKNAIALRGKAGSEESLLVLPAPPIAATANPPTPPARLVGVGDPAPTAEVAVWLTSAPLPPQNQGTVRILDFWNIFCGPCIANLPKQQEFWEAHRREGLEMIALHPAWNEQEIREFLAARPNVRFPIAIEKEGCPTSNRYPIEGVPTYVVIDPDGKIEFIGAGDWEGAKAKALSLLAALAKQKAESP
jgi:protocatechuate 3,4-dioxygenase beta subunit